MPELIRNGQNGFLVYPRPGCVAGLLEFLEELESDNRHKWELAAETMAFTISQWDWSIRSKWYYALFEALITKGATNVRPFTYLRTPPERVGA
jgi:hypothetical protein